MSKILDFLSDPFAYIGGLTTNVNPIDTKEITKTKASPAIPPSRTTEAPDEGYSYSFENDKRLVQPGYQFEIIPVIRKLSLNNQSLSQALQNIVSLANTGHQLFFDSGVKPEQIDKMRTHLEEKANNWQYGIAGTHGLANKFFHQAMISGATCQEVVPNLKMDGIYRVLLPYPETIRFLYNKATISYEPYQVSTNIQKVTEGGFKKLNINSFKYVAINGDSEKPYGNPPYLPSLGPLTDQKVMLDNIKFIIRQIGVVGFLEVMVAKPEQNDLESDAAYEARLNSYLDKCTKNMTNSLKNGIVTGFKDDHEFDFHTTNKTAGGISELFNQNQKLVSSGLKQDGSLMGEGGKGAETAITIIFTKLLSELKNIQICIAAQLEFIYKLELRLAGFKFESLSVEFKPSTIQDDLKIQQGLEIKIRNLRQLLMDGIIDMEDYADELGYEKPARDEPLVPLNPEPTTGDPNIDAQKKAVREKSKDKSDRRSRDRKKSQGTIKPK